MSLIFNNKKAIRKLLQNTPYDIETPFRLFLEDYINGKLKEDIESFGISKVKIYVEPNCIDIQGRHGKYYVEVQIYPTEFYASADLIECEDDTVYPLVSKEDLYNTISTIIQNTNKKAEVL